MQANRSRDTSPELALRRALHALGLRYRVCARPLRTSPQRADVVFGPSKVVVEVRGCFWHGCPQHYKPPITNGSYWAAKIARNTQRDDSSERALIAAGWQLVVVWEHDDISRAAEAINSTVRARHPAR